MAKKEEENMSNEIENILDTPIEEIFHTSMISYAEDVIMNRALPRVEDGLKPVQRRILYSMYDVGLFPDKPYKKSAKVVGDCLGKYHPHGDSSVYDAMVKMAQPFSMGMTLIDGQGNFGSIDGDGAAAMRYTETRLNNLALEMLRDIDKDTVEWQNNYDDSLKEPVTLPSRFPNILVNGSYGIAVGLATNIPPHNLSECIDGAIEVIKNPKVKIDDMMKIIPGPDFPTGGTIIESDELKAAYETGKGKIQVYPVYHLEDSTNGKKNIVINEIPFRVNKGQLLKKMGELIDTKEGVYSNVADVIDESDRHGLRIVIVVKKDGDPQQVLDAFLKDTQLNSSFGINMVVIADGKPQQLGVIQILKYYVDYQRQVVLRRTKFDLAKAKNRFEIVSGLIIAVTNIDKVIKIIKNSPDTPTAKQTLRKTFDLSDVQAQAILDLKLAKITKLEVNNLKEELESLKELMKYLQSIVDSKKKLDQVIIDELSQIKKSFKRVRKTQIKGKIEKLKVGSGVMNTELKVENCVLGITATGYIKRTTLASYSRSKSVEPTTSEVLKYQTQCRTNQLIYIVTDLGNLYTVDASFIPETKGSSQGNTTLQSLVKYASTKENPVALFPFDYGKIEGEIILFTENGYGKITNVSELKTSKGATVIFKLKDDDKVLSAFMNEPDRDVLFVTRLGMGFRADKEKISRQGGNAGGCRVAKLGDNDKVYYVNLVKDDTDSELYLGTSYGTFKKLFIGTINKYNIGSQGVNILDLGKKENNAEVVLASVLEKDDRCVFVVETRLGIIYYIRQDEFQICSRTSEGKYIASIGRCEINVVYCARR